MDQGCDADLLAEVPLFAELSRVLKADGRLIFSVPLYPAHWTEFDDCVGHARRYVPEELLRLIQLNIATQE